MLMRLAVNRIVASTLVPTWRIVRRRGNFGNRRKNKIIGSGSGVINKRQFKEFVCLLTINPTDLSFSNLVSKWIQCFVYHKCSNFLLSRHCFLNGIWTISEIYPEQISASNTYRRVRLGFNIIISKLKDFRKCNRSLFWIPIVYAVFSLSGFQRVHF